ncbi:MAG: hypothetical protein J7639_29955 [Paenibacillaceae bacterium]|nr:hypothetical protein [Paenibacillaceae bacterium]
MRVPVVRFVFALLAMVFAAAIVVQVFLAGMALFVHVGDWSMHRSFINYFEYVPILMFILAFPGRIRGLMRWLGLVLFVLCSLQHITVQVLVDVWVLGALHPIIAMLLFMFSAYGVRQSWRWLLLRQDSGTIAA